PAPGPGRRPARPRPPAPCPAPVPQGGSACRRAAPSSPCRRAGHGPASRADGLRLRPVRRRKCRSAGTPTRARVRGSTARARGGRGGGRWEREWPPRKYRIRPMDAPDGLRGSPLYDAAALRALEADMAGRLGGGFQLMARAGQAGWRELLARWPGVQRIVVVCGPGNNGGDGYELCRHAHESGRDARVLRIDAHAPRTGLAERACEAYREAGGRIKAFEGGFGTAQLVVDALFGIGLTRAPDAASAELIDAINGSGLPVFSLDVPSGLDADRGCVPGRVVHASHTLQLLGPHPGLYTGAAARCTGTLALSTLGADAALAQAPVAAWRLGRADLRGWIAPRARDAHKGDSGHVLCIGGDTGRGGAVMLATEAALRCGAGLASV